MMGMIHGLSKRKFYGFFFYFFREFKAPVFRGRPFQVGFLPHNQWSVLILNVNSAKKALIVWVKITC